MSRGSTILAEKGICCWCGSSAADKLCACRRVSFCNKECMVKAWPEHRLSCPKVGGGKKENKFYNGDIVEIKDLKSEKGMKLNGLLGEVVGEEKDRLQVLVSPEDFVIKSFSLKPENVKIHLSVPDAAAKCVKLEREMQDIVFPQPPLDQFNACRRQLPRLSGKLLISRFKEGDIAIMLAFQGYNMSPDQSTEMLQNGLIDLCYEKLKFPIAYDTKCQGSSNFLQILFLQILCQSLAVKTIQQDHFRSEALQKIAAVVVLTASKKRRIFGRTDDWLSAFHGVLWLFGAFCVTDESDDFWRDTMPTIVGSFDPCVRTALIEIMIAAVSIEPAWFVRKRGSVAESWSKADEEDRQHRNAQTAFAVLVSIINSKKKNLFLRQVGFTKVPMGSEFVGQSFASSFLKITAVVGLQTLADGDDLRTPKNAANIYLEFLLSNDEALLCEVGPPDIEYVAFVQFASVDAFRRWAEEKLASDE